MTPPFGKRRTREHVIADLSVNYVERQALLSGYTVERMYRDYGVDLELNTFNEAGEMQPGAIRLQLKATDGLALRPVQKSIPFRIQRKHLLFWREELMPVMLIVFDARKTRAYWVCIQTYFEELQGFNLFTAGETITVHIPVANRVNLTAMRKFARLRDEFRKQSRRHGYD